MNDPRMRTVMSPQSDRNMGDCDKLSHFRSRVESQLNGLLNPIEPLVMRLQSLLVWEYPRRSAVMLVFTHMVFWFVSKCCVQVYSLVSASLMVIFFVDTWKKKIWPEIRVPPSVPEDVDGWTPVHPRLLNVPEISRHLASMICYCIKLFDRIRGLRREKPFVFFLFSSLMFVSTAALGQYMSGFMIIYTIVMSVMIWPSLLYHKLLKRAYLRMEPAFMWLDYQLKSKCRIRRPAFAQPVQLAEDTLIGGRSGGDGRTATLPQVVEVVEEEDFEPSMDPATTAALARAITDSEDEGTGGTPSIPTPGLSKEPSTDNSDDERRTDDFNLDVDDMPSFDDLDHSDDELTPVTPNPPRTLGVRSGLSLSAGDINFTHSHFDADSDSEDESTTDISFPDVSQSVLSSDTDAATATLTSALVTKTLSSMMESALQGVMGMTGGEAKASGRLPRTGTKITYTKTPEGESIDFATPEPTITEDDEGCEPSDDENSNALDDTINNEVAEIEKDFDFLDELEAETEPGNK